MPLSPKLRIGLGVTVIFVAGGLCGALVTAKVIAYLTAKHFTFENFTRTTMKDLDKRMQLTPEQKVKIEAVVRATEPEFKDAFAEFGNITVRLHNRVHPELTPDQQRLHDEMLAETRKMMKEKMKVTLPDEKTVPPRK